MVITIPAGCASVTDDRPGFGQGRKRTISMIDIGCFQVSRPMITAIWRNINLNRFQLCMHDLSPQIHDMVIARSNLILSQRDYHGFRHTEIYPQIMHLKLIYRKLYVLPDRAMPGNKSIL
jgi:hypothetical protein